MIEAMLPTYLDHNATTLLAPGVIEVMTRYLATEFGNPSSGHHYGRAPKSAARAARQPPRSSGPPSTLQSCTTPTAQGIQVAILPVDEHRVVGSRPCRGADG